MKILLIGNLPLFLIKKIGKEHVVMKARSKALNPGIKGYDLIFAREPGKQYIQILLPERGRG